VDFTDSPEVDDDRIVFRTEVDRRFGGRGLAGLLVADHGVEGLTDTERWNTNIGRKGVVVNGDRVTATGLFVEHFQEYNTRSGTATVAPRLSTRTNCRTTRRPWATG
jgi:hypothetical protein